MKRIILIALLIIPITFIANSQIKFGIKAGVTSTSLKADDIFTVSDQTTFDELVVKSVNSSIGFQGGIFTRITILKLYIQPELLFTSSSGEVEVTSLLNGAKVESAISEQTFRQIDFPIMVGYKFGPARFQLGPVGTIMLSSDPSLDGFMNMDYKEEYNGATWGYQVGAGLDILKKLTIDLKYEGSFSKLGSGIQLGDQDFDFDSRNSKIILTLGWMF
ncbi:MAG: hypothetical protein A2W99_02460 [Bacteroidetes bacterium GWF2_33_16]|nr:MAG: hypothetical protein A2X00_15695 [Bacteroidetes bacterium GWE2_32_14]OFY07124.1 MAG: hypothetical protein A2W99_02460 [Bacteroidetes bacterium GWF2_33_16]